MESAKVDLKKTIHLPQTGFSMKANLGQLEPKLLAHWDACLLYTSDPPQPRQREIGIEHNRPLVLALAPCSHARRGSGKRARGRVQDLRRAVQRVRKFAVFRGGLDHPVSRGVLHFDLEMKLALSLIHISSMKMA